MISAWCTLVCILVSIAPSAPPQSVSESVQSSTGVFIQWSPPQTSDTNGIIRSYTIILVNTRTGTVASYSTTNTNINITNLSPYTEYRYNVSATTVSAGPFSSSMTFTTLEDSMLNTCTVSKLRYSFLLQYLLDLL